MLIRNCSDVGTACFAVVSTLAGQCYGYGIQCGNLSGEYGRSPPLYTGDWPPIWRQDATSLCATFRFPASVAVDAGGTVYVADTVNNLIRAVSANSGM